MTEAVAELVSMAREADQCREMSLSNRNEVAARTDAMFAAGCMEAARRIAKRHGLPKPWLNDDLKEKYKMRITL